MTFGKFTDLLPSLIKATLLGVNKLSENSTAFSNWEIKVK